MGNYQYYVCKHNHLRIIPSSNSKGECLQINTITRGAYLKYGGSFSKKKNLRQSTIYENPILPKPYFHGFSLDLTTLGRYHFITLNICQMMHKHILCFDKHKSYNGCWYMFLNPQKIPLHSYQTKQINDPGSNDK